MMKVRHIKVSEDEDGQRLSRWMKKHAPEVPFHLLQKLMRTGQIRVDGKRAKQDVRLTAGQDVRIPPLEAPKKEGKGPKKLSAAEKEYINSLVIYDDGDVIAINKPPGLATQGGTNMKRHVDGLLDGLKRDKDDVRPRLVHRLDKDTSGVLLLARSAKVAKALGEIFKGREAKKIYWALVTPAPPRDEGSIKAPLAKAGGKDKEKMTVDEEEGKFALTDFVVLDRAMGAVAFMAFWPRTGRTHQIRVHAQVMGSPVLGDGKYGGGSARVQGFEHARGLHLHARRIICPHPVKKGKLDITAPLPPEMAKSWKAFGFDVKDKSDPFADVKS